VHVPRRRCVGCGRVAPKSELMRLVAVRDGRGAAVAVHDERGTMPGRGAYLCLEQSAAQAARECFEKAQRRSAIGRALRCPVAVPAEGLESVSQ
jgi:predicted RNA-binding protein YlxR (DUF448 family)